MRRREVGPIGRDAAAKPAAPRRVRLRAPLTSAHYVARPRLIGALDAALESPVTLVIAPAGAGKTTLAAGWLATSTAPTAWLSLDDTVGDATQLWSGIADALEVLRPGCAAPALARLRGPDEVMAALGQLVAELAVTEGERSVLVLDDVHEVDDDPLVAASLTRFLQNLPAWLRVLVISRRAPNLPFDRMRVRGQLTELGFDELRFSAAEARELMSRLAPTLSEEQIVAAAGRADGWAASLQLAAVSSRSTRSRPDRPDHDARVVEEAAQVGDDTHHEDALVHDYVMRDVLAAEDEDLVRVLVDTSIVERLSGSLAGALAGRDDADKLLQLAAARGLFVSRLGSGGWFRVHSRVRSVLRAELSRRPDRLATQHARAARWFEEAGEIPTAIDQLFLAGDDRGALRLLAARAGELYDGGLEDTVRRAIAAVPSEVAASDVGAMIDYAWCHLLVSRRRFSELVDQLTWWVDHAPAPLGPPIGGRVCVLASMSAFINGDWTRAGELARRALVELGDAWWRDMLGRFGWTMVAREVALDERWDELSDELREIDVMLSRDPHRRLALEGTRALGEALAGRPVDALRVVAGVRRAVDATNMTMLRGELRLAEALALRELGDRATAAEALEALVVTASEPLHYCRVLAVLELTLAKLDDGDLAGAERELAQALAMIEEQPAVGWWDAAARVATRVALARGDQVEAGLWSRRIVDPFWRAVSEARVHVAAGDQAAAAACLDTAQARCVRHEVVVALLWSRVAAGSDESVKQLGVALEVAAANGMLQTVVSEAGDSFDLVEHVAWRVPDAWIDRLRRAATGAAPVAAADAGRRTAAGLDALTERERDVLRFLPSRLTQQEIASELFVSLNTLKFHLKVIYRKLGVGSRSEAAEVARRMASSGRPVPTSRSDGVGRRGGRGGGVGPAPR